MLVLTSLATLGLEKYALRCLPAWHNHQDWARSSGFLQFSRRLILVTSLVLVVLFCVTLELTLTLRGKPYHVAIVIVAMFLPATAMFQFILEVAAAYGGQLKGVASYRLLFPALMLLLNAGVWILLAGKRRRLCRVLLWRCLARRHCRAVPHDAKLRSGSGSGRQSRCASLAYGCAARSPWLPAAWCSPCLLRPG